MPAIGVLVRVPCWRLLLPAHNRRRMVVVLLLQHQPVNRRSTAGRAEDTVRGINFFSLKARIVTAGRNPHHLKKGFSCGLLAI